jgi:hypothetical protein
MSSEVDILVCLGKEKSEHKEHGDINFDLI